MALALVGFLRQRASRNAAAPAGSPASPAGGAVKDPLQAEAPHDSSEFASDAGMTGQAGTVAVDSPPVPQAQRTGVFDVLRRFGLFWYDFVVGDDWRVAVAVAASFAIIAVLSTSGATRTWWIVPATAILTLPLALASVVRKA
ncbi:hypothetical protein [Arthrobacter sp. STN4]|uniref:hypothetical protein n=1 Tax=Arthrobacter sp. STN4 TaxID=2923276 RepID=UPI002119BB53|nr:hypothetical protein [Arthrobacter sp. STN4]MCQ9164200.1 hypothetical protein [Arthrobacter sp. STN4]